ncbi:Uncharacterised protein [Kingella potus]|uniref:Uncharacterized protein n=1 Tax=Kingella potus TaxID=265175 RepID=A0A377R472_9NEIS|nr:Uncharacterised protein [Kingella potus]
MFKTTPKNTFLPLFSVAALFLVCSLVSLLIIAIFNLEWAKAAIQWISGGDSRNFHIAINIIGAVLDKQS